MSLYNRVTVELKGQSHEIFDPFSISSKNSLGGYTKWLSLSQGSNFPDETLAGKAKNSIFKVDYLRGFDFFSKNAVMTFC